MTSFVLKIIALISMFCDHFGDAFFKHYSFLNLIGRIAFPIFAFQISEGYIHTKNLKKYMTRLFIFAIISQIPFSLFLNEFVSSGITLNIFFTLFLGLVCIKTYDYFSKSNHKILGIFLILIIFCMGEIINVDYGCWGIIVIFMFYLLKNNKCAMILSYISLCIIRYSYIIISSRFSIEYIYLAIATIFPIIFISLYNGKQGYRIKYLLYVFYPIHLLLLYFLFQSSLLS